MNSVTFDYEPRELTPTEKRQEKLLKEYDDIETELRWDITLEVNKFNFLLTKLLKLWK